MPRKEPFERGVMAANRSQSVTMGSSASWATRMTTLEVLSVLFAIAAIFGLISTRWLKLPITVGTMLLTVLVSMRSYLPRPAVPGIHRWA